MWIIYFELEGTLNLGELMLTSPVQDHAAGGSLSYGENQLPDSAPRALLYAPVPLSKGQESKRGRIRSWQILGTTGQAHECIFSNLC